MTLPSIPSDDSFENRSAIGKIVPHSSAGEWLVYYDELLKQDVEIISINYNGVMYVTPGQGLFVIHTMSPFQRN